jgi:DNA polymerase II small subunit/DNA polymerase delta subunit B
MNENTCAVPAQTMEQRIDTIHYIIKELFPEAIGVNIHVTSEGITATPEYRTNVSGYSMRTISGKWVKKVSE